MKRIIALITSIMLVIFFIGCNFTKYTDKEGVKDKNETSNSKVYYCGECLKESSEQTKYCPNCGKQCEWKLSKNKTENEKEQEEIETKNLTDYTADELYKLYTKEELKEFYYEGKLPIENLPQAYANEIIHEQEVYYCDYCNKETDREEIVLNGGVCNACKNSTSNCKLCGTRISNDIYIENNGYCNDCVEYSNPCFYCGATTNLSKIVSYIPEVGHYMCPYCQSQHICSNCYNIVDYIDPNSNICSSCVNELYNRPAYICNNCKGCTHTCDEIPEGTPCSYCGANSGYSRGDVCHCFD